MWCLAFFRAVNESDCISAVGRQRDRQLAVLFRSLAALDPSVGHNMDVLSPFISVLCHSD